MKRLYENNILGYYIPAFFFLDIETKEDLDDLENISPSSKAILIHEYVHFLQDILNKFGLTNICNVTDIQKAINDKILRSDKKFSIPITYEDYKDIDINFNLIDMCMGSNNSDFNSTSYIKDIKFIPNGIIPNYEHVPEVQICFINKSKDNSFSFGSLAIIESMAYLIERNLFDKVCAPEYPYKAASIIFRHICPKLADDDLNVIAVCDISLNTDHPGKFFVEFLNHINDKKIKINSSEDLYELARKWKFGCNLEKLNMFETFDQKSQSTEKQLCDFFPTDSFKDVREWIVDIFSMARGVRKIQNSFWIAILSKPTKKECLDNFIRLIGYFGYPVITNELGEYYFSNPRVSVKDKNIISLKAIYEIKKNLEGEQIGCQMKNLCKKTKNSDGSIIDATSLKCETPWERANEDLLCPFGRIWKVWGLSSKELEVKKLN